MKVVFSILMNARFPWSISMIVFMELYLYLYLIWYRLNSDSRVNDIYIIFVILHIRWSGKAISCYLSVGNMLMFVMRAFSCVMIAVESSLFSMAYKILRCTLDEFMTEFCFSGRISRVYFVMNLLLITVQWLRDRWGGCKQLFVQYRLEL